MIDTGSQVTSLAHSTFQRHFSHLPLHDIRKWLRVDTASGSSLPYDGYFECTITIPVADNFSFSETVPVLVVHDTAYNARVPLLLGTNILKKLLDCPQKLNSFQLQVAI